MFGLSKKLSKKKGFTLIEIMIVIAIIGLLSVVLIPKAVPLKNQAKNNVVQANVYIVRSFLENRAGADKINIISLLETKTEAEALTLINNGIHNITGVEDTEGIGSDMNTTFSGSSTVENPFSGSRAINSTYANIVSNDPENSAIVIGFDTGTIPANVSDITNTINTPGVIAIIVYKTGYVVYGIDSSGVIIEPTLVNMPNNVAILPDFTNPTTPTSYSTTAILSNIDRVYDFLSIDAAEKIIIGEGRSEVYNELQKYLFDEIRKEFKWNSNSGSASYNAIENPVITGYNEVVLIDSTYIKPGINYSVFVCQQPNLGTLDYSNYRGVIVVYPLVNDPIGYCIYGIDADGNKVGERQLTLPVLMNSTTENNLSNNVNKVADYLQANISNHKATCGTGFYGDFVDKKLLKELESNYKNDNVLINVYVNNWNGISYTNSTWLNSLNSILLTKEISSGFSSFKGTTIVNALKGDNNTLVGYEVYGINYNGDTVGYKKIQ